MIILLNQGHIYIVDAKTILGTNTKFFIYYTCFVSNYHHNTVNQDPKGTVREPGPKGPPLLFLKSSVLAFDAPNTPCSKRYKKHHYVFHHDVFHCYALHHYVFHYIVFKQRILTIIRTVIIMLQKGVFFYPRG